MAPETGEVTSDGSKHYDRWIGVLKQIGLRHKSSVPQLRRNYVGRKYVGPEPLPHLIFLGREHPTFIEHIHMTTWYKQLLHRFHLFKQLLKRCKLNDNTNEQENYPK